jgi:signal transduction histidine kinase
MTLYEKRALLLELLFRKLRGQVATRQTRNRHLEQYVDMVAHDLKEPLAEAPFETVHMTEVMANVQGRLSHQIREQQAQVVLAEDWSAAIGFGPWIEEVWANDLSNALKFRGRPPYVELGASVRSEGVVHFWVRDNGPGIPPAARNHLFSIQPCRPRLSDLSRSI